MESSLLTSCCGMFVVFLLWNLWCGIFGVQSLSSRQVLASGRRLEILAGRLEYYKTTKNPSSASNVWGQQQNHITKTIRKTHKP